jgi:hypothetical protein
VAVLLLKLFLGPLLVVISTVAGRRWGDQLAGILVALPVVAGPILFVSHELHGADFTADAAASSLLGLVSLAVFAVVFSWVGRRYRWATTTLIAWVAVLLVDLTLSAIPITIATALPITLAATCVAIALMPAPSSEREAAGPAVSLEVDLVSRAVVTAILVVAITTASGALGPGWTGLLAPFPTALTVVAAFVRAQRGAAATIRTLRGALIGLFGFAVFCAVVAASVRSIGASAFVVGVGGAVIVQVVVLKAAPSRWARISMTKSRD